MISRWKPRATAPIDGTHFLAACGPYDAHWGFHQRPPAVVHYWSEPGEEGFYLSHGGSAYDEPFEFTDWTDLGLPPGIETSDERTDQILREQAG